MIAADRRMVHSARKLELVLWNTALQNSKMEKALECRQKGKRKNGACCKTTGSKAKDGCRSE